mmetsp:Transcript_35576/g.87501  ORF Transcript_35576/g.87501 Transcript_35576/m.87501 type:complete len:207 (-) Transcript_35576:1587-2207(-)
MEKSKVIKTRKDSRANQQRGCSIPRGKTASTHSLTLSRREEPEQRMRGDRQRSSGDIQAGAAPTLRRANSSRSAAPPTFLAIFIDGDLGGLPEAPPTEELPTLTLMFRATGLPEAAAAAAASGAASGAKGATIPLLPMMLLCEKRQALPARHPPGRNRYMHSLSDRAPKPPPPPTPPPPLLPLMVSPLLWLLLDTAPGLGERPRPP